LGLLTGRPYYEVSCLAISPDSRLLFAAGHDDNKPSRLRLWSLPDGQLLKEWEGPPNYTRCAVFTPDGKLLVTATYPWSSSDHFVRLWSVPDAEVVKTLKGHAALVKHLAVAPDGRHLVSGDDRLAAGDADAAREAIVQARARLAGRSGADDLRRRADCALGLLDGRARLAQFERDAREAEFHLIGHYWAPRPQDDPDGPPRPLAESARATDPGRGAALAEKALGLYGLPGDVRPVWELTGQGLSEVEARAVRDRAGELLVMLALAVERQAAGGAEAARRRAAGLLATAEALGNRSRSLYMNRARLRRALGEQAEAAADERAAERAEAATLWDLHQQGHDFARAGRWEEVVGRMQAARALRPGDFWTLFRMARAQEHLKQPAAAEALYRSCLDLRPLDPVAHNSRGAVLLRQGRCDEAAREFETSIDEDADYLPAYGNLMLAHAERKQLAEAEAVLRRYLDRRPPPAGQAAAWNNLGLACERAGDLAAALRHYDAAVRLDAKSAVALRNRALLRGRPGRFDEAQADIRAALALEPDDADLHWVRGNLYAARGRDEEAVKCFSAALERDPKFRPARNNRGVVLHGLGHDEESLADLDEVVRQTPNDADVRYNRALTLAAMGRYRAALEDLNRADALRGENAAVLLLRGKVWSDLGALPESERDISRSIEMAPDEADGYRSRAITRMKRDHWDGALDGFRQYLKLRPDAPDAPGVANDMSKALRAKGQLPAALEALDGAIAKKKDPPYLANRASTLLDVGQLARALDDLEEATRLAPRDARPLALRGTARLRQGRPDDALANIERAIALAPEANLYETLLLRALAQRARGWREAARADLERVARERPDHARGKFARAVLRLDESRFAEAVADLSAAADEPVLRPFALALRARVWLGVGGAAPRPGWPTPTASPTPSNRRVTPCSKPPAFTPGRRPPTTAPSTCCARRYSASPTSARDSRPTRSWSRCVRTRASRI
jgi:tetratricopeptide (TPR) repeat protein